VCFVLAVCKGDTVRLVLSCEMVSIGSDLSTVAEESSLLGVIIRQRLEKMLKTVSVLRYSDLYSVKNGVYWDVKPCGPCK
jgi:hypothetical protein